MATPRTLDAGPWASVAGLRPDVALPMLTPVRHRRPPQPRVRDVAAEVRRVLEPLRAEVTPGMRVAVTAGSRGIHDIATMVTASVSWLREAGAAPFVVPAMGSHGGATEKGQRAVLADLGIDEDAVGAPVRATMDTVVLGHLADGTPVHHDAEAAAADGVLLVNRVKPHTDFRGPVESGLAKIAAIGLGNHRGAETLHAGGIAALPAAIEEAVQVVRGHGHLLGGVAVVENADERTAEVAFLPSGQVGGEEESALREKATALLARLPFEQLDVLVVDETGKDKSGTGMDTNVLGRCWVPGVPEFTSPRITVVTVHRLTEPSHGNAAGLGLADLAPAGLMDVVDVRASYVNALTSGTGGLRRSRTPMLLEDDDAVLRAAVAMCGRRDRAAVRLARVRDTLTPGNLLVSPALLPEVAERDDLDVVGPQVAAVGDDRCLTPFPDLPEES